MSKSPLLFVGACALATLLLAAAAPAQDKKRPNIVWILSEDNSKHFLKHWDPTGAPAPNIEALAAHGITFDNAFSNAPVCSVARTTLITGCYAPRIGTQFHRKAKAVPMPEGLKMFPAYLRDAGYYTTNNSKEDYNAIAGDGVWDDSSNKATWRNRPDATQPFFHQVTFKESHESSLHFSKQKMEQTKTETDPATVFIPPIHPDTPTFRYTYARYHDRMAEIDRRVGQVVAALEEDGLLEDTFVFYFGDHGGVLPGSKGYANDRGLHVPLAVRVPDNFRGLAGHEPGSRTAGFVSFVDFGPTALNLAGVAVPGGVDGRPFLGEGVTPEQLASRDTAYGYADRFDEKYDFVRTFRQGKFHYERNYTPFNFDGLYNEYRYKMLAYQEWWENFKAGSLTPAQAAFFQPRQPEALYDLEADPYQTNNLASAPEHAERLATMRDQLTAWVKGMPDLSFYPESYLIENAFDNPVAFGRSHEGEIAELVDIANLQLLPFAEASPEIGTAIASQDAWRRYWGYTVCAAFGQAAATYTGLVQFTALRESELLVRARANQFWALAGAQQVGDILAHTLESARTPTEALEILNIIVMLRDGAPGIEINLRRGAIPHQDAEVKSRVGYLLPVTDQ